MAKCYLTGIEIPTEESFLLNIGVANQAVKDLRSKLGSLERLLSQLGPKDEVDIYSVGEGKKVTRKDRRLVCKSLADSLEAALPDSGLFMSWEEYRNQRKEWFQTNQPENHWKDQDRLQENPKSTTKKGGDAAMVSQG
jgi:tRNA G46 methylase TrmB